MIYHSSMGLTMTDFGTIQEVLHFLNSKYPKLNFKAIRRDNVDYIYADNTDMNTLVQFMYEVDINGRVWLISQVHKGILYENNEVYLHCYEALESFMKTSLYKMGLIEMEWLK